MAIQLPNPPDDARKILDPSLNALFSRDTAANRKALQGKDITHLRADEPHRCYFVELDQVANGLLLSAAVPALWRYLVHVDDRVVADAELFIEATGKLEFAAVNYGRVATATVEGIGELEKLRRVYVEDYELRSLEIQGLHFVSLWLHGATDDVILTIAPTPHNLRVNISLPLTEKELLTALQPAAAEAIRRYAAAPRGSGG